MSVDNKELESLAREKADEIIYRQKVQELSSAVTDVIRVIPNSLQELRYALEIMDRDNELSRNTSRERNEKLSADLREIKKDMDSIFVKLREINPKGDTSLLKIIDKNDDSSLVNQIAKLSKSLEYHITDMNNEKSVSKVMENKFNEQTSKLTDLNNEKSLLYQINKNSNKILMEVKKSNDTKALITWIVTTVAVIGSAILGIIMKWIYQI